MDSQWPHNKGEQILVYIGDILLFFVHFVHSEADVKTLKKKKGRNFHLTGHQLIS